MTWPTKYIRGICLAVIELRTKRWSRALLMKLLLKYFVDHALHSVSLLCLKKLRAINS